MRQEAQSKMLMLRQFSCRLTLAPSYLAKLLCERVLSEVKHTHVLDRNVANKHSTVQL